MRSRVGILGALCLALLSAGVRVAPAAGPVAGATDAVPAVEERVYLTEATALREIFPGAAHFPIERRAPSDATAQSLQKTLGVVVTTDSVSVWKATTAEGVLLGYAVVSEEIGKYHPITFMVGASPDLKVERVSILVYRESHGGEVRRQRFLSQYRGKSFQSPIRINQDIVNISGATLSVRALNQGVRRVMGLLEAFYGPTRH